MKMKIGTGTSEEFFKRALVRAKKMDRGERLKPEMRITFSDPAELLRALTEKRIEIILTVRKQSAGVTETCGESGAGGGSQEVLSLSVEMNVISEEMQDALLTCREFLEGIGDRWAWGDFLSVPAKDPQVRRLQGLCRQLPTDYPPASKVDYCGAAGLAYLDHVLREVIVGEGDWAAQIPPEGE